MKKGGLCLALLLVITGTFIFQMFLLSHSALSESLVQDIPFQRRDVHSDEQSAKEYWPHFTKSATLLPAFTDTPSSTHVTNHTTMTPPVTNHTTRPPVSTTNHTTIPVTTNYTTMTPSSNHTTIPATTNHTTIPVTTNHTTIPVITNHTTIPVTTNHTVTPLNHTTISPTTHNRTSVSPTPFNYTTGPTTPVNYTTATACTNSTDNKTSHMTTATSLITSAIPTNPPEPERGDYIARSGNMTYARIMAGIQLCIKDPSMENEQHQRRINVPKNATVSGSCCKDEKATIVLSFSEGTLSFTFQKNDSPKIVYLSETDATISFTFSRANEKMNVSNSSLHMFETAQGRSYYCSKTSVDVSDGFSVNFFKVQLQAHDIKDGKFGAEEKCPEDKKNNYVIPIVIVVVLVILIIIVILAYVIGRKRSHQGYTPL
ncbi:macrosialin [Protopterus annectens]|uniref:macrosialin n=1 Tax=Protopterus annectens TaxID=7888 RepID=UPI001CFBA32F|nr:macrosialin [Protopterus annectens]